LVIIDSPDFTHRVAKRVRAKDPRIPIVDYVSPSVWAWRPGRARAMLKYVDHVLALLPFVPEAYQRLRGPPLQVCRPSPDQATIVAAAERR
jgi:lipid-A-disaccharide synthase